MTTTSDHAREAASWLTESYAAAVNAGDAEAYKLLFTDDAIRIPPGLGLEIGPDAIGSSEGADYREWKFDIAMETLDALELSDRWVFGTVKVEADLTAHSGTETKHLTAFKSFLLERQPDDRWLIKRYSWNLL